MEGFDDMHNLLMTPYDNGNNDKGSVAYIVDWS